MISSVTPAARPAAPLFIKAPPPLGMTHGFSIRPSASPRSLDLQAQATPAPTAPDSIARSRSPRPGSKSLAKTNPTAIFFTGSTTTTLTKPASLVLPARHTTMAGVSSPPPLFPSMPKVKRSASASAMTATPLPRAPTPGSLIPLPRPQPRSASSTPSTPTTPMANAMFPLSSMTAALSSAPASVSTAEQLPSGETAGTMTPPPAPPPPSTSRQPPTAPQISPSSTSHPTAPPSASSKNIAVPLTLASSPFSSTPSLAPPTSTSTSPTSPTLTGNSSIPLPRYSPPAKSSAQDTSPPPPAPPPPPSCSPPFFPETPRSTANRPQRSQHRA